MSKRLVLPLVTAAAVTLTACSSSSEDAEPVFSTPPASDAASGTAPNTAATDTAAAASAVSGDEESPRKQADGSYLLTKDPAGPGPVERIKSHYRGLNAAGLRGVLPAATKGARQRGNQARVRFLLRLLLVLRVVLVVALGTIAAGAVTAAVGLR